jgi:hypothetical protein
MTTFLLIIGYNVLIAKDDNDVNEINNMKEFFIPVWNNTCLAMGYSLYFFAMSMFSWMTLLCWDLLKTFYHLRPFQTSKGCSGKLVIIVLCLHYT